MKSLLLSSFILLATFSFAENDMKSNIEATITEINTNQNVTKKDKDKFVARFNVLVQKLTESNTPETLTEITKEYTRLIQSFTKTTGISLSPSPSN